MEWTHIQYIGDSVYVEFDGFQLVLTTNNSYPDDPRNTIGLEPDVYNALALYVETLERRLNFQYATVKLQHSAGQ